VRGLSPGARRRLVRPSPFTERVKRRLCIGAGLLLLGAIINVAVARGCAYWIDGGRPLLASPVRGITAPQQPRWDVLMGRRPGSVVIRSSASRIPLPPLPLPPDATREEIAGWRKGEASRPGPEVMVPVPRRSRAAAPPGETEFQKRAVWEDARGWPALSLVSFYLDFGGRAVLVPAGNPRSNSRAAAASPAGPRTPRR
jgi:hypothetical protein